MVNMACRLCGSGEVSDLFSVDIAENGFGKCVVKKCRGCAAAFIDPLPDPELLDRFYDGEYYSRISCDDDRYGAKKIGNEKRKFAILSECARLACLGGKALLDVGCGGGGFVRYCRDRGWDAEGIEFGRPSKNDAEFVRYGVPFEKADIPELRYDAVTFWHSLEHMRDPLAAVARAGEILKSGGCLIIAAPNRLSFDATLFGTRWAHYDLPRHLYHFSLKTLKRILDERGFDLVKVGYRSRSDDIFSFKKSGQNVLGWAPEKKGLFFSAFWKLVEFYAGIRSILLSALRLSSTITVAARKR